MMESQIGAPEASAYVGVGAPVAWKVYVYGAPTVVVNGGVSAMNTGAADTVETVTVNGPAVAELTELVAFTE